MPLSEYELEKLIDQVGMSRLATDPRYKHAENLEAQAEAEAAIFAETEADLIVKYGIEVES